MPLPDLLPTDPDELEALYASLIEQDDYSQDDYDRLMDARLRVWGIDPERVTPEQLIGAMHESMNRMLLNLRLAVGSAPDEESRARLAEAIGMAEQLQADIDKALSEARDKGQTDAL